MKHIWEAFLLHCIGLAAVTALLESLLPERTVFRAVRVGIGLWYLAALFTEISVILLERGG